MRTSMLYLLLRPYGIGPNVGPCAIRSEAVGISAMHIALSQDQIHPET